MQWESVASAALPAALPEKHAERDPSQYPMRSVSPRILAWDLGVTGWAPGRTEGARCSKKERQTEHLEKVRKVSEVTEKMQLQIAQLQAEIKQSKRMAAAGMYWTELLWRGGLPKEAYNETQSTDFWRNAWLFAERLMQVVKDE